MRQHLFGLFLLLSMVREAAAQKAADFSVTHYTNENGLPQNSIKGVEMDKNGFLWIGTESGLLRFDGQQFKLYDRNHFPVIVSNRIAIFGLTKDSLISFFDELSNYYFFNKQQELTRSEFYTEAKATPVKGPDAYEPIVKLTFYKIKGKDEGFVSNGAEPYYISGNKKLWTRYLPDINGNLLIPTGYLNEKQYYLNNQFKIKSVDRKGIIKEVSLKGIHPNLMPTGRYSYSYSFFQQAEALYLFIGKGIYRLHESGEQELTGDLVLEADVPAIYTYRNYPQLGLQIVGSQTHGLYLYRKKQFKALRHTNGYSTFYAQAVYQDSGVLTNKGIVYPSFSKFNYPDITVWRGLLRDSRGHYWVNTGATDKIKPPYFIKELDEHLKIVKSYVGPRMNCFHETSDGTIWMLTGTGTRLGKVIGDSVKLLPKTWPARSLITFLPENNEEFWIGGIHTFTKLNVRTGKEQHHKSLEQFTVETLYLDADKVLWIGTTGNGFFAMKQNKIYQLPLDVKNNLSNVHAFMEDKNGFMWMSTNNGLFRCKKEDLNDFIDHKATTVYYQYFNKDAGFNTNEFNGSCTPSAVVLGNGKFSFPSIDGLVQFYPDSIRELLPEAKIFIDRLLVDGKKQDLSKHPALEPSFKRLEIEVASPFFGNAANQQIEYNVKGLDGNWYPLKNDNILTLNNLPYGKYSLQFRKQAGFGSNNIITTALPFTVKPFFYQTWYFRLAMLALAAIIIFVLVRIRYANLMKRNRTLEQEIQQRTLHLRNANRLKEKMLMMVGHDLQSPLHFLRLLSDNIAEALKHQQLDQAHRGTEEIKSTAGRIHSFVEEFSMWTRLQDEHLNISKRSFSLPGLLEELARFFEGMLLQHDNRLELDIEVPYELYTNHELFKAILRNILDNANKHTRKGLIRIHCYEERAGVLSISISDTGKGMSSIELNNIRRRIALEEGAFNTGHTSKLGYQLIIDFVQRLDAGITIDSEKGKGTTVIIQGIEIQGSANSNSGLLPGKAIGSGELH